LSFGEGGESRILKIVYTSKSLRNSSRDRSGHEREKWVTRENVIAHTVSSPSYSS
jgi:hypothetical protein